MMPAILHAAIETAFVATIAISLGAIARTVRHERPAILRALGVR